MRLQAYAHTASVRTRRRSLFRSATYVGLPLARTKAGGLHTSACNPSAAARRARPSSCCMAACMCCGAAFTDVVSVGLWSGRAIGSIGKVEKALTPSPTVRVLDCWLASSRVGLSSHVTAIPVCCASRGPAWRL